MTNTKKLTAEEKAHRVAMLRIARTPMSKERLEHVLGLRATSIPSKKVRKQRTRGAKRAAAIKAGW